MNNLPHVNRKKNRPLVTLSLIILLATLATQAATCGPEGWNRKPAQNPDQLKVYKGTASKTIKTQTKSFEDLTCVLSGTATLTVNTDNTIELDILMPDITETNSCDGNGDQLQDRMYGSLIANGKDNASGMTLTKCNDDEEASGSENFTNVDQNAHGSFTCSYKGVIYLAVTFSVALEK